MLAAVYHGPEDLRVEAGARAGNWPGEILIKVISASICGTDLRILHGGAPHVPARHGAHPGSRGGWDDCTALARRSAGMYLGQRVFIAPNMGCGHCRQCITGNNNLCANYEAIGVTMDGGFAEYVRVPAAAVRRAM